MGEIDPGNNAPLIFRELPKEQRKALQKEFSQTAEAKKVNRTIIIVAVIFGVLMIAGAIAGLLLHYTYYYTPVPTFFIVIWPAAVSQQKFEKWLMAEKNIAMKRKK